MPPKTVDQNLLDALTQAYTARAKLFHGRVHSAKIDLLIAEIDDIDTSNLDWNSERLQITPGAIERVQTAGGHLHQVFAHPDIIRDRPHLIAYYRNLAAISRKGISQILFSTTALESKSRKPKVLSSNNAALLCQTLNRIVSGVIDDMPAYTVALSRQAILAEIGTEIQGAWANTVGRGAARAVEKLFADHIENQNLGKPLSKGRYELKNGWRIEIGSEPDVAFYDAHGMKQIAIEIKGSLDVAGAQTRYGEAKKSFAKQLAQNPRCYTVYLASCYTDAVIKQIKSDGQVRDRFNLTSILDDDPQRDIFLRKIFHVVNTPISPGSS